MVYGGGAISIGSISDPYLIGGTNYLYLIGDPDPIKFTEIELVDNEDIETIVALYCGNQRDQNALIKLFPELADVETIEDPTPLYKEHGAQEPYMVVTISYFDSQSTVCGSDIDLNTAPKTDAVGDDGCGSSDPSNHEVNSDSDPDLDKILDDIDDECVNDDGNVIASSVENQIQHIMIHNNPRARMSLIDPDAVHAAEFPEYLIYYLLIGWL
ncbi:hypothetical protein GOBAR_AA22482 [Gossypium barbadense]|uniref:Uncharacterized protein n=1 Tax=Gossypium barbadense TaxID=3634 RepID=A0A2P5X4B0_GOSBA|nr:hypothetical protein GOBAR_AA22482 [Gossypium barbadense]